MRQRTRNPGTLEIATCFESTPERAHSTIVTAVPSRPGACVGAPGGIVAQLVTQPDAGESAMTACLQNTRRLSDTVAHLGLQPQRVRQNRLVSDRVVVRIGGQL